MNLIWSDSSWNDYLYWNQTDKQIFKKINALIKEIKRTPFEGTGKPEPLKYELAGCWSRRINHEHRLVYEVTDQGIFIISCKYHY
ncbi:MAG: Txe/YoeB family addiction module toxin [Arcobacteraceae bacterium]